jgi:hypothetical protein
LAAADTAVDQLMKAGAAVDQVQQAIDGLAATDLRSAAEKFIDAGQLKAGNALFASARLYDPMSDLTKTVADALSQQQSALSDVVKVTTQRQYYDPIGDLAKNLDADAVRQRAAMVHLMNAAEQSTLDLTGAAADAGHQQTAMSELIRAAAQPVWNLPKTFDDVAGSISEVGRAAYAYSPDVGILKALDPDSLRIAANALTDLLKVDVTAERGWLRTLAESPWQSSIYGAIANSVAVAGFSGMDVFSSGSLAQAMQAVVGDSITSIEEGEPEEADFLAAVRNIVREEISKLPPGRSADEILFKVMHVIHFILTLYVLLCGDPLVNTGFSKIDRELKNIESAEKENKQLIRATTASQQIEYVAIHRTLVRAAPADSAKVMFIVKTQQIVRFVERNGNWLLVRFINHRDGTEVVGWVQAKRFEEIKK